MSDIKVCLHCRGEFPRPLAKDGYLKPISAWKKQRYCSLACSHDARRKPDDWKLCKNCGKPFGLPATRGKRHSVSLWEPRKYCSRECTFACPEYREAKRVEAVKSRLGVRNAGKPLPLSTREKIRAANMGHTRSGWKLSEEARRQMSQRARKGEESPFWRGGLTAEGAAIRSSLEYKLWREAVFRRDDWTCRGCGARGCRLHADHIKPFALHPELRLEIDNGRTLCVPCHKATPTYLRRGAALKAAAENANLEIVEL
jgi:5-methylcytosine-specific restriction endonuclease McrA